jgi:hypothetical protein
LRSLAGKAFLAVMSKELLGHKATGSKSFNRSHCSGKIAPFTTCEPTWPRLSV